MDTTKRRFALAIASQEERLLCRPVEYLPTGKLPLCRSGHCQGACGIGTGTANVEEYAKPCVQRRRYAPGVANQQGGTTLVRLYRAATVKRQVVHTVE